MTGQARKAKTNSVSQQKNVEGADIDAGEHDIASTTT